MLTVCRFDAAALGQVKRTPQGFLRAQANLTRTGVLIYRRADGTLSRELRRPEEVFKADSLATLHDAPLTDLHPKEMVTPQNVKALSVGHVSHRSVRPVDGRLVGGEVLVTDGAMVAACEAQPPKRCELSAGYKCKLKVGAGVWNGEHYDAEQTDIVYNHVGLGPANWGRAGSEVALRLDGANDCYALGSDDAWLSDALEAPRLDSNEPNPEDTMDFSTLRIDGIDAQVPKQSAQLIEQAITKRDESIAKFTKESTEAKARIDTLQGELDGTKKKLEEAADPKRFDAAVTARMELLDRARKVLGAEEKLDGKNAREIKEAVIKKVTPDVKLDGKSEEYVQALFENLPASKLDSEDDDAADDDLDNARRAMSGAALKQRRDRSDGGSATSFVPAWQRPLDASRDR